MVTTRGHRLGRRRFVASTLGAAVGAVGAQLPISAQPAVPAAVDQNPIRRRGTGLRALDPSRASLGLTLFAPSGGTEVALVDLRGEIVHTWKTPYRPGLYGYLTDRGTLFYNGQIPNDTFLGKSPFMGGAALEMNWGGKVLWEIRRPDHHHDGRLLKNGNVVLLCSRELPDDIARRVRGGRPGTEEITGRSGETSSSKRRRMEKSSGNGGRGSTSIPKRTR